MGRRNEFTESEDLPALCVRRLSRKKHTTRYVLLAMYYVQFMYISDVLFIAFSEAYSPINKPFDKCQTAVFFVDDGARTMEQGQRTIDNQE